MRRILHAGDSYLGRYSVAKLQQFDEYQRTVSWRRVLAVLLLAPLPTLLVLMAMDGVPMNHPSAGPRRNAVAFVRSAISHALMTFATLLPFKQALSLSDRHYSLITIAQIACATALTVEAGCIPLAFTWRFPVPFREMIGLPVWTTSVCVYNYIFAKRTIKSLWRRHKLQLYVPIVGVQIVLFYAFLGLSVGFAYLALIPQTAMILVFPLVKIGLKRLVWKYARALDDISTDVSICMLEVSGSLYQTVCLQSVTSYALSVGILVTDLLQAVHEVHSYMKMDYLGDGRRTLATAIAIVESAVHAEEMARDHGTPALSPRIRAVMSETLPANEVPTGTASRRPSVTKRRPFPRQASAESLFTRQSSMDSLRSIRLTRKSSAESLGLSRQSSIEALGDPNIRGARGAQKRRGGSLYVDPTIVRPAYASRLRRQGTRRLLDLDRFASTATQHDHAAQSDGRSSSEKIRPAKPKHPASTTSYKAVRHGSRLIFRAWIRGRLRRSRSKVFASAASVYRVDDTTRPARVSPRGHSQDENHSAAAVQDTKLAVLRSVVAQRPRIIVFDGVEITGRHQARVLEQTLQLLFVCEVLLFAEYMEVVIPVLYACVLGGEWLLPNAPYNVVVNTLTGAQAVQQVWTSLLYALLELASMLAMYYVMRRRYGVSAFVQLAFVLETYWMTLQGKLVGSFIVVMNALTIHQGADGFATL